MVDGRSWEKEGFSGIREGTSIGFGGRRHHGSMRGGGLEEVEFEGRYGGHTRHRVRERREWKIDKGHTKHWEETEDKVGLRGGGMYQY